MNFNEYQEATRRTWRTEMAKRERINNAVLGLYEAGEVGNLWKKHLYHGHDLDTNEVASELGDILYYVARMGEEIGWSLEDLARGNIAKLLERFPNGFDSEKSINRYE